MKILFQEEIVAADSKAKFLRDAEKYVLHGKVQQAIGEYLKIVEFDPDDVLVLNTVGDLYLKQGNLLEARRCFSKVAENYVQNNFLLKAIAVYKKILNDDPLNLEINSSLASLYAKQGLNVDARNQYLIIAELLEKEGKGTESLAAYEKAAELDPTNAAVQHKLAHLHLAEGANEKAHFHFVGAARAQAKAGNIAEAVDAYERAIELKPTDVAAMGGFLECCKKIGNVAPVLGHLKKLLEMTPDNLDLREMLGCAYLECNNLESAAKTIKMVVSMDESRYNNLFAVAQAFIHIGEYDQAADCLESIVPILITRRETERAVKLYEQILNNRPSHISALTNLACIHSATDDQERHLEMLDKIAEYHLSMESPIKALEYLEKILQLNSESEKHKELHRRAFSLAYPDTPYVAPVARPEPRIESAVSMPTMDDAVAAEGSSEEMVEVDLLLNYGMKEKALRLLQSLETRNPSNKEVRIRLLSLLKEENKYTEAAEQCLLLAMLQRKSKNEEAARVYLAEAKQLDPDLPSDEEDLVALARRKGISLQSMSGVAGAEYGSRTDTEVDLSEDLVEIFFAEDQETIESEGTDAHVNLGVIAEEYPQNISSQAPSKSLEEQLQEADFYIRLGFREEAHAKLEEIAKIFPDHPELRARYQQLGEVEPAAEQQPMILATPIKSDSAKPSGTTPSRNQAIFQELEIDEALDTFAKKHSMEISSGEAAKPELMAVADSKSIHQNDTERPPSKDLTSVAPNKSDIPVNMMFADLMEEFSSPADRKTAEEAFEEHFHLGTAYREMDLMEEAIKEFQKALEAIETAKDSKRIIQCCGMLSTCFIKKGMPRSAVRWCQTGLSVADVSSHEAMALRYDMGVAHSMAGSSEMALECFDQVFGLDPGYRDVAQKIDELRACQ